MFVSYAGVRMLTQPKRRQGGLAFEDERTNLFIKELSFFSTMICSV